MLSVQHNAAINIAVTFRGIPFDPYKRNEMEKLRETVRALNQECFSRKIQLRQQMDESERELKVMNDELNVATTELKESEATRDAWKAEWEFAKYKNFWKRVHRKHIMEDLTDLMKHQKECLNTNKAILLSDITETPNGQSLSLWSRAKKCFTHLIPRTAGAKRRKERRCRKKENFKGIIIDLENGVKMVDELGVISYCSYTRAQSRNKD